jgi:hypothetical protein
MPTGMPRATVAVEPLLLLRRACKADGGHRKVRRRRIDDVVERFDVLDNFLNLGRVGHVQGIRGDAPVGMDAGLARSGVRPLRALLKASWNSARPMPRLALVTRTVLCLRFAWLLPPRKWLSRDPLPGWEIRTSPDVGPKAYRDAQQWRPDRIDRSTPRI